MHRIRFATLALFAMALLGACSGSSDPADADGGSNSPGGSTPSTEGAGGGQAAGDSGDRPAVEVVLSGLDQPVDLVAAPGLPGALLIAEKPGLVRLAVPDGDRLRLVDDPVLDLTETIGDPSSEQGLLGLTTSPDGTKLYTSYTAADSGASQLDEYELSSSKGALSVDPSTRRELIEVDQPFANHNGGDVEFGPDGMLYYALGDGGSSGDPQGNAQDPSTLLGKLLRLDPTASGNVPLDNPFVGSDDRRAEIWSTGLRNPWRFTFAPNGDLWIADVGQNQWEEINMVPGPEAGRGANFGWSVREGDQPFGGEGEGPFVEPVHVYGRDDGCSITGGVVTERPAGSTTESIYLFADLCKSDLRALVPDGNGFTAERFDVGLEQPVGFGVDDARRPYVVSLSGNVSRITPAQLTDR